MQEAKLIAEQLYNDLLWDGDMEGHSIRVAHYASLIAEELGLNDTKKLELETMGLLHDIGKLYIPAHVLNKPGKLTPAEWNAIRKHAVFTEKVLEEHSSFRKLAYMASLHHEFWNGAGYPYGLKHSEIPYEARIIAIADAFDAMTSWRPYRKAFTPQQALERLDEASGTQFWPVGVDAFISAFVRSHQIKELPQKSGSNSYSGLILR